MTRKSWRSRKQAPQEKKTERPHLDLIPGRSLEIEVSGDVTVCDDDTGGAFLGLSYNQRLPENYRRFFVEPREEDEARLATAFIKLYVEDMSQPDNRRCVRLYDYDVEADDVKAYHYVEPEPKPEPEPEPEVEPEPVHVEITPPPPPSPKLQKFTRPATASFARLTKPTRPAKKSKSLKVYWLVAKGHYASIMSMVQSKLT